MGSHDVRTHKHLEYLPFFPNASAPVLMSEPIASAKLSTNQRKYFLHEQLKQIKRELGIEKVLNIICTCTHPCFLAVMVCVRLPQDDKEALIAKFQERLSARDVPDAIQKVIDEETAKLNTLETASSEFNVTRYCRYYEMLQLRARQLS